MAARKLLDRGEIELAQHGGTGNGRLPITYADFEKYGVDRKSIAPALREICALGFWEITERGRPSKAEWRFPNKIRLTYRWTDDAPTNDWKRIRDLDHAKKVATEARAEKNPVVVQRSKEAAAAQLLEKKAKSQGYFPPQPVGAENGGTEPGGQITPTGLGLNTPVLSRLSGGAR
ncbi:hypothetical protein NLM33_05695 [Bradyrhizobium sp. CCGUVB1N3]|uniref:hypothetical protein n=1 Tax=Bradyrhizobium sp. CCGUVB1N3 TaxID=2949629 RepID=UPI0020B3DE8F|nr:hypothetical protein [Bradyrhizobium sp. CCGUVB1N3]MCP3469822.1 hypothetical protein [Bradyrhizobium sp. CCGUVB1N3]